MHKWVDYSSKYGVGYVLSEGSSGVYFNDSSKISVELGNTLQFNYYRSIKGTKSDLQETHQIANCPRDLEKKLDLYKSFNKYLNKSESAKKSKLVPQSLKPSNCYVKKCVK